MTTTDKRQGIVIRPGRCGGNPTIGESRIPAKLVAEVYWTHGMGEAETHWEPHVTRWDVLVCCWYMARYGPLIWRKRWGAWLALADDALWHSDDTWMTLPDPPTKV